MGHRRLRVPRRGVELFRRHLPQQRSEQRPAADPCERGVSESRFRRDPARPEGAVHRRPGQPDADHRVGRAQRGGRDRRLQETLSRKRLRRRGLPAQYRRPDRGLRSRPQIACADVSPG